MLTTRRTFLRGLTTLLAMPAIVKVGSIMPVRAWEPENILGLAIDLGAEPARAFWSVWIRSMETNGAWRRFDVTDYNAIVTAPFRTRSFEIAFGHAPPEFLEVR